MMKKRILSILCIVALLATMLSVGIISATASASATMSLSIVDEQGNAVTQLNPGSTAYMAFSLSDYDSAIGTSGIAVINAFADVNTNTFEIVEEGGEVVWSTPYTSVATGGTFTANTADGVFGAIIETDNNAGETYSISKSELDANNGLLFKVKIAVKPNAAITSESFALKAVHNTSSTSIALADSSAIDLNCDTAQTTVEIQSLVTETVTTILPDTDTSKWTPDSAVSYITTEEISIVGATTAPAGSLVVHQKNESTERKLTTKRTYDFGDKFQITGVLNVDKAINNKGKARIEVGDFLFEVENCVSSTDSTKTAKLLRAYMGEEKIIEIELGDWWKMLAHVQYDITIDTANKSVDIKYTRGEKKDDPTWLTQNATYTGDYSFNDVVCVASVTNNFYSAADGLNVGVTGFVVTKLEDPASSEVPSSEVSSEISSETSSETSSDTSSETSSDTSGETSSNTPSDTSSDTSSDSSSSEPEFLAIGEYPLDKSDTTWVISEIEAYKKSATNDSPFWHFHAHQGETNNVDKLYEIARLDNIDATNGFNFTTTYAFCTWNRTHGNANFKYVVQYGDLKVTINFKYANSANDDYITVEKGEDVLVDNKALTEINFANNGQLNMPAAKNDETWGGTAYTIEIDYKKGNLSVKLYNPMTGELSETVYSGEQTLELVGQTASISRLRGFQPSDAFDTTFKSYTEEEVSGPESYGEILTEEIDNAPFTVDDWTGDTAVKEYESFGNTYYSGIVDGEIMFPFNATLGTIESVTKYDFTKGFKAAFDVYYSGSFNLHKARQMTFTLGDAEVIISNPDVAGGSSGTKPSSYDVTLKIGGTTAATAEVTDSVDALVTIVYDADAKTISVSLGEEKIEFTPADTSAASTTDVDISSYLTADSFKFATIKLSQKGAHASNKRISNYSLWTPDCQSEDDEANNGTVLTEEIDTQQFKAEDWTGDTAPANAREDGGNTYYSGILEDGAFYAPFSDTNVKVRIETAVKYDLTKGFKAAFDLEYVGSFNRSFERTVSFTVGNVEVTFHNDAVSGAGSLDLPSSFDVIMKMDDVVIANGVITNPPNALITIKYDADAKTVVVLINDDAVTFTPVTAGAAETTDVDVSSYLTADSFKNAPVAIQFAGTQSTNRKVSNYSLWTPDCQSADDPSSSEEDTSSSGESTSGSTDTSSSANGTTSSDTSATTSDDSGADNTDSANNGGTNNGGTNNDGTVSKTGETVEYYYYLDPGTYGAATGDSSNVFAAIIVLLAASGIAVGLIINKKRKSKNEK
ncbi:MAG: hypothetical protein UHN02_00810 [Acutalibacteraceae bacterium]|nr:hypothetical protein [Acutalibacteraceae bacterium]